jgi:hypothetical protein
MAQKGLFVNDDNDDDIGLTLESECFVLNTLLDKSVCGDVCIVPKDLKI